MAEEYVGHPRHVLRSLFSPADDWQYFVKPQIIRHLELSGKRRVKLKMRVYKNRSLDGSTRFSIDLGVSVTRDKVKRLP